jgi:hypothetical protein
MVSSANNQIPDIIYGRGDWNGFFQVENVGLAYSLEPYMEKEQSFNIDDINPIVIERYRNRSANGTLDML